eukprot:1645754-Pyramimonas_sp.AAC.1
MCVAAREALTSLTSRQSFTCCNAQTGWLSTWVGALEREPESPVCSDRSRATPLARPSRSLAAFIGCRKWKAQSGSTV